jgi:hypothetical protein
MNSHGRELARKGNSVKKAIVTLALAVAASSGLIANALADSNDTINTTVTPVNIAIDILESGPLAYGNLQLGTQGAVPTPSNFTVENVGSSTIDLQIAGLNTTGGWTLASTAGDDAYVQYYSLSATNGFTPLSTTPTTFKEDLASTAGPDQASVFLKLDMPTSTNNFNQQTMPVKVTATVPN